MSSWAILGQDDEVIVGTVTGPRMFMEAAYCVDTGSKEVRWFGEPAGPDMEIGLRPAVQLADGRWREVAPAGPGMAGQCGGDVQVTEAFSRRFALVHPNNTWAVITYAWYGINETADYVDEDTLPEVVERQIEFLIVEDPHDLDTSLWWDDDISKEYDPDPSEDGVRKHAAAFTVGYIDWDGQAFSR
jgi:hypothetical protein